MTEVERKGMKLLEEALGKEASDIHFHPKTNDVLIQFRVHGALIQSGRLPKPFYERLLSHFKFQAKMDIGEKRRPQSGALTLSLHGHKLSIRLSTLPTPYMESLALRLLPQDRHFSLDELFLFPQAAKEMSTLIQQGTGFMMLTGPTGSGKTTTIYAMLQEAATTYNRRVITIEDPIEKANDGFNQLEVNEKAGITFAEGFKASLRHDPDVIMVGEIRDATTATIAVRAALSGHCVITSMHAKNPLGALYRLLEFGIPLIDIQQTVTAVATQVLVNILCPVCRDENPVACSHFAKNRRLAALELLSGHPLEQAFAHIATPTKPLPAYPTLKDEIKKGIQLGYLPRDLYERWIKAS